MHSLEGLNAFWGRLSGRSAGWFVIFYKTPHASVMEKNGSDIFNFPNGLCDGILGILWWRERLNAAWCTTMGYANDGKPV